MTAPKTYLCLLAFSLTGITIATAGNTSTRHGAADVRARFDRLDTNADNVITTEEYTAIFEKRAARRFERIDADHDGLVTPAEFDHARDNAPRGIHLKGRNLRGFGDFDANGDGTITLDEFARKQLEQAHTRFERIDRNRDGEISRSEFQRGPSRR